MKAPRVFVTADIGSEAVARLAASGFEVEVHPAIEPPSYVAATSGRPLVDYADDWWTYNLGVGYQFREDFAASLSVTYEPSIGGELTTLGPYDGRTTLNIGAAYDVNESLNLSGGVTYGTIGDTYNVLDTDFNDGSVWGAGLRIGYSF